VLITGASSGIGQELAWQLAQAGAKLTLAARRKERLDALAQKIAGLGNFDALVAECDVTRDGDLERAVEATIAKWGRLDVAIANAGFGVVGALKRLSLEDYRRQFETNVFGVLRTIYAALPEIEKNQGKRGDHIECCWLDIDIGRFAILHEQIRAARTGQRDYAGTATRWNQGNAHQPRLRRQRNSEDRQSGKNFTPTGRVRSPTGFGCALRMQRARF